MLRKKESMRSNKVILVYQKGFTAKNDIWKKKKDLENAKELVE